MIPGSNLLKQALRVIGRQTAQWYSPSGRVLNGIGLYVTTFADPVPVYGSFQPIPRNLFEQMGLEFDKDYVTFYVVNLVQDVARDKAPDEFVFAGNRYRVMTASDWNLVDGWNNPIAVKIST